ncbi:uncharacterized protein [Asterias amurensis]|uniref:uncharacterized protein n=1 Tax=Asterias amurensis TaxID=7602 RepID=UPI003AB726EA
MEPKKASYPLAVPYPCLIIDATWRDVLSSMKYLTRSDNHRDESISNLSRTWNPANQPNRFILPCLCVRSAFDLFLQAQNYPPDSELIMTAINIPQMKEIAEIHGLTVVPLDVTSETLAPKLNILQELINDKTVAVLLAHIYGRWSAIDDAIDICKEHNLTVLEDCAQAFCGLKKVGHPKADLSLFSFGSIKTSTAFGGAIVRIRDRSLFQKMNLLHNRYLIQSRTAYFKKILNCFLGIVGLNSPLRMKFLLNVFQMMGWDHHKLVISMLRAFPMSDLKLLRLQPSTALLGMMLRRFQNFDEKKFEDGIKKCDYVTNRLPKDAKIVGKKAEIRNYWLFPLIVDDPERVLKELNRRGIDGYRGATQLTCLKPRPCLEPHPNSPDVDHSISSPPIEAQYISDHVIYLPVHKKVTYDYLEKICVILEDVMREITSCSLTKNIETDGEITMFENERVKTQSKL